MKTTFLSLVAILLGVMPSARAAQLAAAADAPQHAPSYPLPPPEDPSALGLGVQRTMKLLATSTPAHRNKVRILFYGQSITEQEWSKQVADDLRRRFPHADLDIRNRAIGGFAAQWLIRPAEHDLYPFYPDLLIFHVYGSNQEYEEIIKNVRTRTTAEVLMQKDHVTAWPPAVPDEKKDKGLWWDHMMNHVFLPAIARKYGCALVDIRTAWLAYLKANALEPKVLLKDGVHLNEQGNYLLAALVSRYLVYRPELPAGPEDPMVRTLEVGKDAAWKNGRLSIAFDGNRVDAIAAAKGRGALKASARVLIDGKQPSEFPECYCISRPEPGPWSPLFLSRVDHSRPLIVEDWKARVTQVSPDGKSWTFDAQGSITGRDGSGENDKPFVSKSGRVKISPDAWFAPGKVPSQYEVRWKVLPLFVDAYQAPQVEDTSRECAITLAQGLSNSKHTLELIGEVPLRAVRVYRPPVR
ncbi:MAG: SGNH/GDSL hydrolase family protein [Thermoguttaceae bacterium]